MLLIPTYLDKSKIHGIGLFTHVFIPKGTLIWKFHPDFDKVYTQDDLYKIFKINIYLYEYILKYAYKDKTNGNYYLSFDNIKFINHSYTPNIGPDDCALYDIEPDTELTCNYEEFDDDFKFKLNPDIIWNV